MMVAGKPPRPGTILADAAEGLREAGCHVDLALPHEHPLRQEDIDAELVVHRGLNAEALSRLEELAAGTSHICPPLAAVSATASRASIWHHLAAGGVPVPWAERATTWEEAALLAHGDVVVKSERGSGRGQEVVRSPLPAAAPFDGPYLVEEFVPNDGVDRKLYVAGEAVLGLAKPSTLTAEHARSGEVFDVTPELRDVALAAARATNLHLLGVDVVLGPAGPVVVDVNVFPGYRGVPGAAAAVVRHLLTHVR